MLRYDAETNCIIGLLIVQIMIMILYNFSLHYKTIFVTYRLTSSKYVCLHYGIHSYLVYLLPNCFVITPVALSIAWSTGSMSDQPYIWSECQINHTDGLTYGWLLRNSDISNWGEPHTDE